MGATGLTGMPARVAQAELVDPDDPGASPLVWNVDTGIGTTIIGDASCAGQILCVANDDQNGQMLVSTDPLKGGSTWSRFSVGNQFTKAQAVSCPSVALCVGVGTVGSVVTSTNPAGGTAAWNLASALQPQPPFFPYAPNLVAVDCPTTLLCVAVSPNGDIATSNAPTGGTGLWTVGQPPGGGSPGFGVYQFTRVTCASTALCIAGDVTGHLAWSTSPSSGAASWHVDQVLGTDHWWGEMSCPSVSLCLATDLDGRLLTSTDPTGGASKWTATPYATLGAGPINSVSCPSTSFCVLGEGYGNMLTSSTPTDPTSWTRVKAFSPTTSTGFPLGGPHMTCASETLCLSTGRNYGTVVVGSPLRILQLGDSIAAGEGINYNYTYDAVAKEWENPHESSWDQPYQLCHKTPFAHGNLVAKSLNADFTQFACTGARYNAGIFLPQDDEGAPAQLGDTMRPQYLAADPNVVLISLGADDVHFASVVIRCIVSRTLPGDDECVPQNPGETLTKNFSEFIQRGQMKKNYEAVVGIIEARAKNPKNPPRIVFTNYPKLFPPDHSACGDTNPTPIIGLTKDQLAFLDTKLALLNSTVKAAVNDIHATHPNVVLADVSEVYKGHTWCTDDPWAYGLSTYRSGLSTSQAPFHPTAAGQKAISKVVRSTLAGLIGLQNTKTAQVEGSAANGVQRDPGDNVSGAGNGFGKTEKVKATLHSEPVDLGEFTADGNGRVTFNVTIPPGTEGGTHQLVLSGQSSGRTTIMPVLVSFPDAAATFGTNDPPTTAYAGDFYNYAFAATGMPQPTFSLVAGAPSWLHVDDLGNVYGVPAAGVTSFTYSVRATNGIGSPVTTGPYTVAVERRSQTISFAAFANGVVGQPPPDLKAKATSGLPITYVITPKKVCTRVGTKLILLAVGTCTVEARQGGNANWFGATPVIRSFAIKARPSGYRMLGSNGSVYGFGSATALGSTPSRAVAIAAHPSGNGYWTVDTRGAVSHFGKAGAHGGSPALGGGEQVSAMSGTITGNGYWLFTDLGRAFAYGDAKKFGDLAGRHLNGKIIASVATPTGRGYYMVASDGGVFSFGDAKFHGSTGDRRLNKPVVGIAPDPDNAGYWLVASDGGVFAFDAPFRGSMGGRPLNQPVNGMVAYGNGYLMVASDGGVFNFSNKRYEGSLGAQSIPAPIVGIAVY